MSKLLGWIITVIVAFTVMLGPVIQLSAQNVAQSKNSSYNYADVFVDKVADKGSITIKDVDALNFDLASTGITFDYRVVVQRRVVFNDSIEYIADVSMDKKALNASATLDINLNKGDIVILSLEPKTKLQSETLLSLLAGVPVSRPDISIAGMVR